MSRDFLKVHRLVVKIGTNTLADKAGKAGAEIDRAYVAEMAKEVVALQKQGRQVLLVTSGAIGMGAGNLGIVEKVTDIRMRQACAAIGQPLLMNEYRYAFAQHGVSVGQILLTDDVLSDRKSYLNLRSTVETLLNLGVIPIFNENDTISIAEISRAFGDNDRLSALVASKVDAELLIILSDIDGLYDKDPRKFPEARRIPVVENITAEIEESAGSAGSTFSTGGMKTKIRAVLIAEKAGCTTVLAHGRETHVLTRILEGEELGTVFLAKPRLRNRLRWILHSRPLGSLTVDEGALEALYHRKSLLPRGVLAVEGEFEKGSVVSVNGVLKLVTKFSSDELRHLAGKTSLEVAQILGRKDVVARPEDMVFLDSPAGV
ncbi:MAG: glutamate 5-kinase [Spirochaetales bacterium]|nr:glutamate 5-kinase [Spirochaetales bacterium]